MGQCCATGVQPDPYQIGGRKPLAEKAQRSAGGSRAAPRILDWSNTDPGKWVYEEITYGGSYAFHCQPQTEEQTGPISQGLEAVRANPGAYDGLFYQTGMTSWEPYQQSYTMVKRTGSGFRVKGDSSGAFTWVEAKYQVLAPQEDVQHDQATDGLSYGGRALGPPTCPGRGQGCADVPGLKIIGDIDPSDIHQGGVGDCWLLSAISALAEFDGSIARLFRKTRGIESMPGDQENTYIVTLWDLSTWSEVDITIDERLCTKPDGKGLLGCAPSVDGELWACYLEKAVAIHCGGWDKIDGGTCVHAWRLLTGCQNVYTFRDPAGDGFMCLGATNPNTNQCEELANSPHDGFKGLWPMPWPEVGGGGDFNLKVDSNEMFHRMCAWDDADFVVCCGTKAGRDSEATDGIVDGHAYTVLACWDNVAGTGMNLLKVRNPWGKGEFKSGEWDDDGDGWNTYPAVKEALNPVQADDGIFWVSEQEFFKYFKTIYLCAKSMAE